MRHGTPLAWQVSGPPAPGPDLRRPAVSSPRSWRPRRDAAVVLTRLVSCVSIMKLWTCFSALVSSSLRATTATTRAVQPAPYGGQKRGEHGEHVTARLQAEDRPPPPGAPRASRSVGVPGVSGWSGPDCRAEEPALLPAEPRG